MGGSFNGLDIKIRLEVLIELGGLEMSELSMFIGPFSPSFSAPIRQSSLLACISTSASCQSDHSTTIQRNQSCIPTNPAPSSHSYTAFKMKPVVGVMQAWSWCVPPPKLFPLAHSSRVKSFDLQASNWGAGRHGCC